MKKSMFCGFSEAASQRGPAEAAVCARSLGFDGVEPFWSPVFAAPGSARELRRALADAGLAVPCVSAYADLAGPDGEKTVEELKRCADFAAACGSPLLHHTLVTQETAPQPGTVGFERMFGDVVRRAGEVADYASSLGLRCVYEDQGLVVNGTDGFGRFLDALGRSDVGVNADLGNIFFVGETPERFLGRFAARVLHVHVKDYLYKPGAAPCPGRGWLRTRDGGWLRDTVPGHGIVDFPACLTVLDRFGYDGFYSFEFAGPEPFEDGTKAAMENLEYYASLAAHRP